MTTVTTRWDPLSQTAYHISVIPTTAWNGAPYVIESPFEAVIVANETTTTSTFALSSSASTAGKSDAVATATDNNASGSGSISATASNSASASSTASNPPESESKIDGGAIAGAAVGCLVAGLLIGLVAAWLLFRRRKNSDQSRSHVAVSHEPKGEYPSTATASKGDIQLSQFLLSATPDRDIENEMQSLSDLIQQHAENNYHSQPVQVNASTLAQNLHNLGYTDESGLSADLVTALCVDPSTRAVGLRHVISHVVFKSIDLNSQSALSMLPAPVAAFLRSAPLSGRNAGDPAANALALSKWRSLSAFLLHPRREDRTALPVSDAAVGPQAQALADALATFLGPFVPTDKGGHEQQMSHLQAVIFECTKLGYVIFSHPSEWQFIFGSKSNGKAAVVCVGLDKLPQPDGAAYSASPRRVFAPVLVHV